MEEGREILEKLHEVFDPSEGVGLAAPQIGIFKQVCIIHINSEKAPWLGEFKLDLINPKIVKRSPETVRHNEMCFSLGKKDEYTVIRHEEITIEDDLNGTIVLRGFPAYVAQHEIQHLSGETIKSKGVSTKPKPIKREIERVGRNDPCTCQSGRKYKKCCGG